MRPTHTVSHSLYSDLALLILWLIPAMDLPSAGTYWYHSHLSTQYLDGLRGVIVVYVRQ